MFNIRTVGLLVALSLAFSTAQAERLSLSQLKDMIDQLQGQMAQLEETQNAPSRAGFNCPEGLAVTGFSDSGMPLCSSPWPDGTGETPFPLAFSCEDNYARELTEGILTGVSGSTLSELVSSESIVVESTLGIATVENLFLDQPVEYSISSSVSETDDFEPCDDTVYMQIQMAPVVLRGQINIESSSFADFNSGFTLTLDALTVGLTAPLSEPDPELLAPEDVYGRRITQVALDEFNRGNPTLVLSNSDDAVTRQLLSDMMANTFSEMIAEGIRSRAEDNLDVVPPVVLVTISDNP